MTKQRAAVAAATTLAVIVAALIGGALALNTFQQRKDLSVGTVELSVDPGRTGSLDLYVPLVDWGVRFDEAVRLPARLNVDLRTVNRSVVTKVAEGGTLDVNDVRAEARDAIASYLKALIGITAASAAALGLLMAFALRGRHLQAMIGVAGATAVAIGVALVILLPPRGPIDEPQYYAFGPDIPRALEAVEAAQRSGAVLDEELNAQLVGLARLVTRPGERNPLTDRPTITVASDLHNNVLALSILERAADGGPVLFAGDLTDRGSPLEARLTRRITDLGKPLVFVSGNHDSDTLQRDLAERGAVVLSQDGRYTDGRVINEVAGLSMAGYSDPYERRSAEDFKDRYDNQPTPAMKEEFTAWVMALVNRVDVVMVHEPALIEPALAILKDRPPSKPLVFVTGHTHTASVSHQPGVTVVNGGSVGAGGTGNLADEPTDIGIARLIHTTKPAFQPLATDLVSIDPGTGSATARRERLD